MGDGHTQTMSAHRPSPADEGTSAPVALEWKIVAGADAGRAGVAADGHAIFGRVEGVDVLLTDATVSQFHLEAWATEGGIVVRDLGSHNGTLAAGIDVKHASVPAGTPLHLGDTVLELRGGARVSVERSKATFYGALVGASPVMRELYALLERLARTNLSVLVEGETGTGKELAARALHDGGPRRAGPFVAVNCAAIPATLAESVLFGHERGAFTGADERRAGVFEAASGGTVFLDEVAELPRDLQAKLLRALEQREVVPVGATKPRAFDARIVSATWQGLRELVNRGTFREDLYFRLAQARVRMPALRERPDDVRPLVQHFLSTLPADVQAARAITKPALDAIAQRSFPGNARELKNHVERAMMLGTITPAMARPAVAAPPGLEELAPLHLPLKEAREKWTESFEQVYVRAALKRTRGNVTHAAEVAGVSRRFFQRLAARLGIKASDVGAAPEDLELDDD
ncbi:MAG: sigma 54-dependent Fis family transcriptional regulator [Labilithrix sp.]|nr:sigma 54-dependent Fis family transcriptional regulator [Labilithrix sp.]